MDQAVPKKPEGIDVFTEWTPEVENALQLGGKVLLLAKGGSIGVRKESWRPVFWNRLMFPAQGNPSLGLLVNKDHPALASFLTRRGTAFQWRDAMKDNEGAWALNYSRFPQDFEPIVQIIPDWNSPRKEALLYEAKVGRGKLLVCSMDLMTDQSSRPAARQLLNSLYSYVGSEAFSPSAELTVDQVKKSLLKPRRGEQAEPKEDTNAEFL